MNKIQYKTKEWVEATLEAGIPELDNCFLKADGPNGSGCYYFGQFKENDSHYTVIFYRNGFDHSIDFKVRDTHTTGLEFNIKNFIEKHNGKFGAVTKDEFFQEYDYICNLSSRACLVQWPNKINDYKHVIGRIKHE